MKLCNPSPSLLLPKIRVIIVKKVMKIKFWANFGLFEIDREIQDFNLIMILNIWRIKNNKFLGIQSVHSWTRVNWTDGWGQIWTSDEVLPSVILSKFPSPDWAFIAPYKIVKYSNSRILLHLVRFWVYFSSVFSIFWWFFSMIFVFFGIVNNTNIASRYFSLLILNK